MERSSYIQACVVGVGPTGTRSDLRASNPVCLQGFFLIILCLLISPASFKIMSVMSSMSRVNILLN